MMRGAGERATAGVGLSENAIRAPLARLHLPVHCKSVLAPLCSLSRVSTHILTTESLPAALPHLSTASLEPIVALRTESTCGLCPFIIVIP
jgi:hypothetical protein